MKNLILILTLGFGLFSCVKKEEEVVLPYVCQDCIEIYEIEKTSPNGDTTYSSRIDTVKFTYCDNYEYQNSIGGTFTPIYGFDSLGHNYIKGYTHKLLLYWHCENKDGYGIISK